MNKLKRTIGLIAVLFALIMPASAQMFFIEEDLENKRNGTEDEIVFDLNVIDHDIDIDVQSSYVPVGSGVLLLAALGGAYLIGKKKKS